MNRTFVMPPVERGLIGEIVARLERKGSASSRPSCAWSTRASRRPTMPSIWQAVLRRADHVHHESPVFAMVVEGPADNTFSLVRWLSRHEGR